MDSRLGQHVYGQQLGGIRHMCPDCGIPPRPLCPTCLGAGSITTERLDRWQAQHIAEAQDAARTR